MCIFSFLESVYKMSDVWIKAEKDSIPNLMRHKACPQVASETLGKMPWHHKSRRTVVMKSDMPST